MSRRFISVVGVAAVLFGLVAGVASAQEVRKVQFETSFAFMLNGKEMSPGRYEFEARAGRGPASLVLRNLQSNERTVVQAITRLADLGGTQPQVIFDKTEDAQYLAELHIPGIDGFDLQHAPGEHTHTRAVTKQ
jgi:hypothetical protein